MRFKSTFTIGFAFVTGLSLSACAPSEYSFEPNPSFAQEDHIDQDLPTDVAEKPAVQPPSVQPPVERKPAEKAPNEEKPSSEKCEKPEIPEYARCGEKMDKVLICHVPPGNPAAAQEICISLQGAIQGHDVPMDGTVSAKSGDRLGPCSSEAVESKNNNNSRRAK